MLQDIHHRDWSGFYMLLLLILPPVSIILLKWPVWLSKSQGLDKDQGANGDKPGELRFSSFCCHCELWSQSELGLESSTPTQAASLGCQSLQSLCTSVSLSVELV